MEKNPEANFVMQFLRASSMIDLSVQQPSLSKVVIC